MIILDLPSITELYTDEGSFFNARVFEMMDVEMLTEIYLYESFANLHNYTLSGIDKWLWDISLDMPNLSYVEMYSSGFDRKNVDYCYNSERTYYKNRMILMSIAFYNYINIFRSSKINLYWWWLSWIFEGWKYGIHKCRVIN